MINRSIFLKKVAGPLSHYSCYGSVRLQNFQSQEPDSSRAPARVTPPFEAPRDSARSFARPPLMPIRIPSHGGVIRSRYAAALLAPSASVRAVAPVASRRLGSAPRLSRSLITSKSGWSHGGPVRPAKRALTSGRCRYARRYARFLQGRHQGLRLLGSRRALSGEDLSASDPGKGTGGGGDLSS